MTADTKKNIIYWIVTSIVCSILLLGLITHVGIYSWLAISIILGYLISLCNNIRQLLLKDK